MRFWCTNMPSRPSPRWSRGAPRILARYLCRGAGLAVLLAHYGCASAKPPAPAVVLSTSDAPYIVQPFDGYPLTVDREREARVNAAWSALMAGGDPRATLQIARELLVDDPGFHPGQVVAAAAELVLRDPDAIVRRLSPVQAELPAYTASALLLGRSFELTGDPAGAYAVFHVAQNTFAAQRAAALLPDAVRELADRVEDALGRNHVEDAESQLRLMRAWAPRDEATLIAARAVAVARGDAGAELVAVRSLNERHPEDRGLSERRGDLEAVVGDAKVGMQIFEALLHGEPGNSRIAEKLARVRFHWRMQLLPASVREVARHAQLSRGELALLLYWLLPDVRYGQASSVRIATDVLESPYREEIVRVMNQGLLDLDEALHRFGADRAATRPEASAALLRVLARGGHAACLSTFAGAISRDSACDLAASCALIAASTDCVPPVPLSGGTAIEMIRHTVDLLGTR